MFWRRFLPKSWTEDDSTSDDKPERKDVSVNRRGFFRQLAISAIEEAEKAGHDFLDRANLSEHFRSDSHYSPTPSSYPPPYYASPDMIYGPPWPPPMGPDIPPAIRKTLREQAQAERDHWYGGGDD
ncbi:hypothetical protein HED60_13585 [Planctomycetales bacterium ZRK34]|nr:hypothetical protein HED60_13585 [Planctomycetales bacterium ZRK34]